MIPLTPTVKTRRRSPTLISSPTSEIIVTLQDCSTFASAGIDLLGGCLSVAGIICRPSSGLSVILVSQLETKCPRQSLRSFSKDLPSTSTVGKSLRTLSCSTTWIRILYYLMSVIHTFKSPFRKRGAWLINSLSLCTTKRTSLARSTTLPTWFTRRFVSAPTVLKTKVKLSNTSSSTLMWIIRACSRTSSSRKLWRFLGALSAPLSRRASSISTRRVGNSIMRSLPQ